MLITHEVLILNTGEKEEKINNPQAVRAVGTANATNRLPIIIPCHRVIGKNGSLTGFGGGLATNLGTNVINQVGTVSFFVNGPSQQTNSSVINSLRCTNPIAAIGGANPPNVEEVRNILRTMLCRNLINKAEGQEMRERKKAREKDEYLNK